MPYVSQTDNDISTTLTSLSGVRPAYWSYSETPRSSHAFDFFQYPAMMVPDMLRDLITSIKEADGKIQSVCDPFLGSGSVLTEAMLQGLDFDGTDVNPLALLIAKVKSGPLRPNPLGQQCNELLEVIEADRRTASSIDFPGVDKWFTKKAIRELSAIRRAIRSERKLWCRRFFWVCLAETVRLSSNSRTSTYKLHIRDAEDLEARANHSPLSTFRTVLAKNLKRYAVLTRELKDRGLLKRGLYTGHVSLELADCRSFGGSTKNDLLITSPPYGDNCTTVPYGQHSYLPLQCIDLEDIDDAVDVDCLRTTRAIDSRSLGGHQENALSDAENLRSMSPSLHACLRDLAGLPRDRALRVATFSRDLHASIVPIMSRLRKHGYMVWVVGNRRVGGKEIPTSQILGEFLIHHGATHVTTIERLIPTKRMATKNAVSATMSKERILVFRNRGTE